MAAWVSLSFHSRDDYFHVLAPAVAWLNDPNFDWDHSDLPGAGIRSHLLPRIVYWLLRGMIRLHITTPEAQLRGLYIVMGIYSLWLVVAMYQAGARFFGPVTARRAAFCAALFFPFPYAGTRLLIEALAMPPLLAGLTAWSQPRRRQALVGGLLVGLAIAWRLQAAAVLPGIVGALCWDRAPRRLARLMVGCLGLARRPCGLRALRYELQRRVLGPHVGKSFVQYPYASASVAFCAMGVCGLLVAHGCAPAAYLAGAARMARGAIGAVCKLAVAHICPTAQRHRPQGRSLHASGGTTFCPAALRSMDPAQHAHPAASPAMWQATWPTARTLGGVLLALALGIAITGQSQGNLRDAMRTLREDTGMRGVVSMGPELQTYFLGRPSIAAQRNKTPDEAWLRQTLIELHQVGIVPNRFVAYSADQNRVEVFLRLCGYTCAPPAHIDGWWLDRWLARLNPRRNQRRGPVLIYRCETPDIAAS